MKLECYECRGWWIESVDFIEGQLQLHLSCPQCGIPTRSLIEVSPDDVDQLDRLFDCISERVHVELAGSVFVPFMGRRGTNGVVDAGIIDSLVLTYDHVILMAVDLGHKSPAMERALRYAELGLVTLLYRSHLLTIPQLFGDTRRLRAAPASEDLASFELDLAVLGEGLAIGDDGAPVRLSQILDLLTSYEANRFVRDLWPEYARARNVEGSRILGSGLPGLVGSTAVHEIVGPLLQSSTALPESVRAWSSYSRGLEEVGFPSTDVVDDIGLWWSRTIEWPEAAGVAHVLEMREAGHGADFVNTALSAAARAMDEPDARRRRVHAALDRRVEAAWWTCSGGAALQSCAVSAGLAGLGALIGGGAGAAVGATSTMPPLLLEIARRRVGNSWVAHFLS